jgi:hypothetical protein
MPSRDAELLGRCVGLALGPCHHLLDGVFVPERAVGA